MLKYEMQCDLGRIKEIRENKFGDRT